MSKYTICNDWNEVSERYWFICENGEPICDEDGNSIHFPTYEDAEDYMLTRLD
jgi:hypothetical protein